jgi:hypothetical protein
MRAGNDKAVQRRLAEAARGYDKELTPKFLTAPADEKQRHDALMRKVKRRRGRPKVGAGAQRVQFTVERSLLGRADRFARARGLSRSELIAEGLLLAITRKSA